MDQDGVPQYYDNYTNPFGPEAKSQLGDDVTAVGMTQDGQGISLPLADPETPPEQ